MCNDFFNENINDLLYVFSTSSFYSFQNNLTHKKNDSKKKNEDIFVKNSNDYFIFLFNSWRKWILSIPNSSLNNDLLRLKKELFVLPQIQSLEDIYSNPYIGYYYRKYGLIPKRDGDWFTVSSEDVNKSLSDSNLFLSINSKHYDLFKICRLFHQKCEKRGIPFLYQYSSQSNFKDNLIIWSNDDYHRDYIEILEEIKNEYPNLINRCGEPSLLVKKTDSFYGIGKTDHLSFDDYYSLHATFIYNAIQSFLFEYVNKTGIDHDFLAKKITSKYIREVNANYLNIYSKNGKPYKKYQFFLHDINKKEFYQALYNEIKKQLDNNLEQGNIFHDIHFSYGFVFDKSKHTISKKLIQNTIQEEAFHIFQNNSKLYFLLSCYIKDVAEKFGISDYYFLDVISNERKKYLINK